jgi:hypothetical protein
MDTVPSAKIAGIALARVMAAQAHLENVSPYSTSADDLKAARAALSIASELLALIAPKPQEITRIRPEPIIPPAPVPEIAPEAFPMTAIEEL